MSILDSHLLMTLSKGEGGACVYMRGARRAFNSNTIYCEESDSDPESESETERRKKQQRGTHIERKNISARKD